LDRKSASREPPGECSTTACSSAEDFFWTLMPALFTSSGSFAEASCTRLRTLTALRSGLEPTAKVTVSE